MRGGYRNMYHATGQPGWMRFGYSPGWAGRSRSGLGPCAEYLLTGRWPTAAAPWFGRGGQAGRAVGPGELETLKAQAERLESMLEQLRQRIADLEKES